MNSILHLARLFLVGTLLALVTGLPLVLGSFMEGNTASHHLESRSKLKSTVLSVTNAYRAKHGAPPLAWNSTLATYASEFAKECKVDPLTHSNGPYAESLADYPSMKSGIKAWYSEVKYINFDAPKYTSKNGHYINMMFASVTQIGCAKQACDGAMLEVCEYWPLYTNMLTPKGLKKNLKAAK